MIHDKYWSKDKKQEQGKFNQDLQHLLIHDHNLIKMKSDHQQTNTQHFNSNTSKDKGGKSAHVLNIEVTCKNSLYDFYDLFIYDF